MLLHSLLFIPCMAYIVLLGNFVVLCPADIKLEQLHHL